MEEQNSSSDDDELVNWAAGNADDSSDGEPALEDEEEEQPPPPPPRAPEAPPNKKRKERSKAESEAARRKTKRRKLEHEAAVTYFLARLRLLSRWCDDPLARDAAQAAIPPRAWRNACDATEADGVGAMTALAAACRGALLRSAAAKPGSRLGLAPAALARAALAAPADKDEGGVAMLLVSALRGCGVGARLVGQLDVGLRGKRRGELWVEARVGRRVVFINAVAGRCVLASAELLGTKARAYVVACDAGGGLRDVGHAFRARGAPAFARQWLVDALHAINAQTLTNPWAAPAPDALPASFGAFRAHPTYALRSCLSKRERLRGGAQPVATFRGEPVFARRDVECLRTVKDWARRRRRVRDHQQPRGALGGAQEDDDPIVAAGNVALDVAEGRAVGLYGEEQTDVLEPVALADGRFPTNAQGDVEIMDGDARRVPPGATWVKGADASRACAVVRVECAPVLVGFDRRRGKAARPRKDGVLVRDADAAKVVDELRKVRAVSKRKAVGARRAKVRGRWAVFSRGLLTRDVLRGRYGA